MTCEEELKQHRLLKDVRAETDYVRYPVAVALARKLDNMKEADKKQIEIIEDVLQKKDARLLKLGMKLDGVEQLLKNLKKELEEKLMFNAEIRPNSRYNQLIKDVLEKIEALGEAIHK